MTLILVFTITRCFSQAEQSAGFVFVPGGLHFAPLRANSEEPRIGVFKFLDAAQMKVDVGNSIDLFAYNLPESGMKFSAGIDFMAYAFTTGAQGLRLQIDAIDGLFGGNLTVSKSHETSTLFARLRIIHHSAHFADGHYDAASGGWIDNREPIAFTRDFGELVLAWLCDGEQQMLRTYGGLSYATLIRPTEIQRFSYLAGAEYFQTLGRCLEQPFSLYAAYQISLSGVPAYSATHQVQLGAKFGDPYGKGPSIFFEYYTGKYMFGQYYNENLTTIGAGFAVDFF